MESSTKSHRVVRRRQDPVSCRLCRSKKLKCNRSYPCSNCIARKAECEFDSSQVVTNARIQHDAEPSNSAILSRLQRLEDMILRMNQNTPTTPDSVMSRRTEPDQSLPPPLTPAEESHLIESSDLSCVGTRQPTLYPAMSHHFIFDTVPLDYISKHESTILDEPYPALTRQRRIILPLYSEAIALYDKYASHICHYHHVIHVPTFRKTLERLYASISRREPVNTDHAALALAILSAVLCYTRWSDEADSTPAELNDDRERVFVLWFRAALDLLDHSRRVLAGSVEIIQAGIILMCLDYNIEGLTYRSRSVLIQVLHTAKELSLNRLDSPAMVRRRSQNPSVESIIDIEVKRRLWWHLVATDWMISLAGSAQEGSYSAHPSQMRVRLPRNIEDDILERGDLTEDLPLTHPTPMTYSLHRIRLGEINRSVVDVLRFGLSDPSEHDYKQVLQLDERIKNFLEDLPVFLKVDEESRRKSQYIVERYPFFAMQRYIINIGAQSVRCKLHQPYLVRGNGESQYAQSAQFAIAAAMAVIEINKAVRSDDTRYIPQRVKVHGLLHHMFLATIVLVMDLCFNRMNGTDDSRNEDVRNAIGMLEEAKDHSSSVQKFLDSLMEALKKHQVRLVDPQREEPVGNASSTLACLSSAGSWPILAEKQPSSHATSAGLPNYSQTTMAGFDDMWRGIADQGESDVMPDWDQLFSELDAFIA